MDGDYGLNCGSHACVFTSDHTGYKLTGPCVCAREIKNATKITSVVRNLKEQVAALRAELEAARRREEWCLGALKYLIDDLMEGDPAVFPCRKLVENGRCPDPSGTNCAFYEYTKARVLECLLVEAARAATEGK